MRRIQLAYFVCGVCTASCKGRMEYVSNEGAQVVLTLQFEHKQAVNSLYGQTNYKMSDLKC